MRSVPQSEVADRPFLWTRGVAASETLRYLDKNGVDVEAILSKAQLSRSQLSQDSGGISVASQHRFLEFAAVETNDSLLGLHVAAEMDLRDVGILFYLAAASATVAEALEHLARYSGATNYTSRCRRRPSGYGTPFVQLPQEECEGAEHPNVLAARDQDPAS